MTDATEHRIHVLRVPTHEIRREPVGEKWCFNCRKHLPHDAVTFTPDDPRSYYGPHWHFECSRCHRDFTAFPGMTRVYDFEETA